TCSRNDFALARSLATVTIQLLTMSNPPVPSADIPELPCKAEDVDDFLSQPDERDFETVSSLRAPVPVLAAGGKIALHLCLTLQRALAAVDNRAAHVLAVSRFTSLRDRDVFDRNGIRTLACDLTNDAAVAALPDANDLFFLAGIKFGTASA